MKKIFICSPYIGEDKTNFENLKRYCARAVYSGIPIAP